MMKQMDMINNLLTRIKNELNLANDELKCVREMTLSIHTYRSDLVLSKFMIDEDPKVPAKKISQRILKECKKQLMISDYHLGKSEELLNDFLERGFDIESTEIEGAFEKESEKFESLTDFQTRIRNLLHYR